MNDVLATTNKMIAETERWIEVFVEGLNLCPFAKPLRRRGGLKIVVAWETELEPLLQTLVEYTEDLLETSGDASTLVILGNGGKTFDEFLDVLAIAEALFADLGLDGQVQIASFHPAYQFEGSLPTDVTNWTNRSPYPTLHLLLEADVSRATDTYPDTSAIPTRNIAELQELGSEGLASLIAGAELGHAYPDWK